MMESDTAEATQDAAATAQRMIDLLLEVLAPLHAEIADEADIQARLQTILSRREGDAAQDRSTDFDSSGHRAFGEEESAPTLTEVAPPESEAALATWFALTDLFDRLGPERLAAVDQQTDFRRLPPDVLQAIEIHLDDPRLSSVGKILAIAQVLLGQRFTQQ